jgi:uncharacterized repeat protein (TIGR01451 family)
VPDLALDKRAIGTFAVGHPGTYVLMVANVGTLATSGAVTVRDTLAAGLGYASATGTGWSVSASGQIVTATHAAPIAIGDSASFTLVVDVMPQAMPFVMNSATVSGGGDLSSANDTDVEGAVVLGNGALLSQITASAQEVEIGDDVDYTLTLQNVGDGPITAIELSSALPAGMRLLRGSARVNGSFAPDPAGAPGPALVFPVGDLLVGQTYRIAYRVEVGAGAELGTGENFAVARGMNSAPGTIASNTAAATVHASRRARGRGDHLRQGDRGLRLPERRIRWRAGPGELGIPGVDARGRQRPITDAEGKYHFNQCGRCCTWCAWTTRRSRGARSRGPPAMRAMAVAARGPPRAVLRRFRRAVGRDSVLEAVKTRRARPEPEQALVRQAPALAPEWDHCSPLLALVPERRIDLRSLDHVRWAASAATASGEVNDLLVSQQDGKVEGRRARRSPGLRTTASTTLAFDSGAPDRRLFSDIRPNEGYDPSATVVQSARSAAASTRGSTAIAPTRCTATSSRLGRGRLLKRSRGGTAGIAALDRTPGASLLPPRPPAPDRHGCRPAPGPTAVAPDGTLGATGGDPERSQPAGAHQERHAADAVRRLHAQPFTGRLLFRRPFPA